MRYQQLRLADAAEHFERLASIALAVRTQTGREGFDAQRALQTFARRGDTAALAWDGDQLVGVTCLGLCHHFITAPEWMPFKMHLVGKGYNLGTVGCSHFVYLSPDHWGAGVTFALTEAARRSNPVLTHTLSHSFATQALEDWAAKLPGMVELSVKGPGGKRVFVREIL